MYSEDVPFNRDNVTLDLLLKSKFIDNTYRDGSLDKDLFDKSLEKYIPEYKKKEIDTAFYIILESLANLGKAKKDQNQVITELQEKKPTLKRSDYLKHLLRLFELDTVRNDVILQLKKEGVVMDRTGKNFDFTTASDFVERVSNHKDKTLNMYGMTIYHDHRLSLDPVFVFVDKYQGPKQSGKRCFAILHYEEMRKLVETGFFSEEDTVATMYKEYPLNIEKHLLGVSKNDLRNRMNKEFAK